MNDFERSEPVPPLRKRLGVVALILVLSILAGLDRNAIFADRQSTLATASMLALAALGHLPLLGYHQRPLPTLLAIAAVCLALGLISRSWSFPYYAPTIGVWFSLYNVGRRQHGSAYIPLLASAIPLLASVDQEVKHSAVRPASVGEVTIPLLYLLITATVWTFGLWRKASQDRARARRQAWVNEWSTEGVADTLTAMTIYAAAAADRLREDPNQSAESLSAILAMGDGALIEIGAGPKNARNK